MTMKNYEVVQEDGTSTHYQIDDSDDTGKGILKAWNDAAKDPNNPVTKVAPGDPEPINAGRAKGGGV